MSAIKAENAPLAGAATIVTTEAATTTTTTTLSATPFNANICNSAFQFPAHVSSSSHNSNSGVVVGGNNAAATSTSIFCSTSTTTSTTTTIRNNISVTNIKCEADDLRMCTSTTTTTPLNGNLVPVIANANSYFNGSAAGGSLRIPLQKAAEDSDSEAELTNIENLKVTRRTSTGSAAGVGVGVAAGVISSSAAAAAAVANHSKNGPRPMSWEGELSEPETTETDLMETENSVSNDKQYGSGRGLMVIKSEATTTTPATVPPPSRLAGIKPDLEQISVELISPYSKVNLTQPQSDPINLKYEPSVESNPSASLNSPLLARNKSTGNLLPANPSPDSAIHSVYTHSSPSQSPLTSRHAPYTPSLSRNNSDASHSSCYSYSSEFSPTNSPIQGRHSAAAAAAAAAAYGSFNGSSLHHSVLYRPITVDSGGGGGGCPPATLSPMNGGIEGPHNLSNSRSRPSLHEDMQLDGSSSGGSVGASSTSEPIPSPGISRQQLINSPCPICGDKISGFHYGIFSCESCKGFFKRTVQNRKNYVCVRGGPCPVSISTRKKCPACRFEKCLQKGMKLEAIREDRTRGGRSTYQCSYTLPNSMLSPLLSPEGVAAASAGGCGGGPHQHQHHHQQQHQQQHRAVMLNAKGCSNNAYISIKTEHAEQTILNGGGHAVGRLANSIPVLMQEIMDVEHLWQYNEAELARLNQPLTTASSSSSNQSSSSLSGSIATSANPISTNPLLASAGLSSSGENANPDLIAHLCNVADHRLYKIVKWCKSLPLFKNISIDDQISLLINSWCELLLFSCCFRSVDSPGEIKMSQGKKISLAQAKSSGLQVRAACIERMLNLTDHLRRLRVDRYEYVAMKVIVLLQSDTSELQEPVKVRECQEKALQSLQAYTLSHYPDAPSKFGELLLRIPDLQRTCQLGKEMLTIKSRDGGDFNLLMELLRGEH